jgi:coproporphyrinogen III oxidase-like Fe-S oxidoreductase
MEIITHHTETVKDNYLLLNIPIHAALPNNGKQSWHETNSQIMLCEPDEESTYKYILLGHTPGPLGP